LTDKTSIFAQFFIQNAVDVKVTKTVVSGNREGEVEPSVRGARRKDKAEKLGPSCSFGRWPSALRFIFFFSYPVI
jgi:hypothetical protein